MLLGILLLVATGSCWVVIGAVVGHAAKHDFSVGMVQACTAAAGIVLSGVILALYPDPACAPEVRFWTMLSVAGSGFFNYFVLVLMGKAMKEGPNGIVWAVIQSALIFPFLVGVIGFGVELTFLRLAGLVTIIAALALFGFARENRVRGNGWKLAALGAFLCAGINQNLSNLPSYFADAVAVGSVSRAMSAQVGTLAAYLLVNGRGAWSRRTLAMLKRRTLWSYVALLVGGSVLTGYLLMYRGLNLVAEAGAGAVSYPVMVSSCIVSFTLYSVLILKEKLRPLQTGGLALALVGIVCISVK